VCVYERALCLPSNPWTSGLLSSREQTICQPSVQVSGSWQLSLWSVIRRFRQGSDSDSGRHGPSAVALNSASLPRCDLSSGLAQFVHLPPLPLSHRPVSCLPWSSVGVWWLVVGVPLLEFPQACRISLGRCALAPVPWSLVHLRLHPPPPLPSSLRSALVHSCIVPSQSSAWPPGCIDEVKHVDATTGFVRTKAQRILQKQVRGGEVKSRHTIEEYSTVQYSAGLGGGGGCR
jgi:hypothetical protein